MHCLFRCGSCPEFVTSSLTLMKLRSSGLQHSAGARWITSRGAPSRLALGVFPNKCRFVTWNAR
eukprot:11524699-Karenia_brevis.AAC.1